MENPAASLLIVKGNEVLDTPYKPLNFTKNAIIDKYLNDLDNYPHFFVLACIMDRQMKAENAWKIPYYVSQEIGSPYFKTFSALTLEETLRTFNDNNLHRYKSIMGIYFYQAVQRIFHDYDGYASRIWRDDLSAITIMKRFLQFDGAGIKIASMATNILIREFKLPIKDKSHIDISPDIHVRRVFTRLGFIDLNSTNEELVCCARTMYPEYPGVFDLPTWEVGRLWCKPKDPDCKNCYLNPYCRKNFSNEIEMVRVDIPVIMKKHYEKTKPARGHNVNATEPIFTEMEGAEHEQSVKDFRNRIKTEMVFKGNRTLSFPGGLTEHGENYMVDTPSGILTITVIPDKETLNRYYHFINLDQPDGIVSSDIEINIPKSHDKRLATLLARSKGQRYICNRGRCTVYMSAIKRSIILDHFDSQYGNVVHLKESGIVNNVIRIANLDDDDLLYQIALFTRQMKAFKNQFR